MADECEEQAQRLVQKGLGDLAELKREEAAAYRSMLSEQPTAPFAPSMSGPADNSPTCPPGSCWGCRRRALLARIAERSKGGS